MALGAPPSRPVHEWTEAEIIHVLSYALPEFRAYQERRSTHTRAVQIRERVTMLCDELRRRDRTSLLDALGL